MGQLDTRSAPTTESSVSNEERDRLAITTIRTLAMDAVQMAQSGHPGTAMAMSPVVYCLWQRFLRFDPDDPIWPNRDRFVLSIGHASMLLYAMLHLSEVKAINAKYERLGEPSVSLDDIKRFRQLDSRCPGHPEYRWTSGVEMTTGPLGQGVAASVGMALGSRWMGAYFNRPGFDMIDHDVYALAGDGCLMEGVTAEAASLAGHLRLSNLCWIYDNNRITIEGSTALAYSDDVATRFLGYGWNVTRVGDANDLDMLSRAFETFKGTTERPTLIIVDSHIGYGAPHKQDTSAAHGEPLGEEEIRLTKRAYDWPEDAQFLVPDEVRVHFRHGVAKRGRTLRADWMDRFERYRKEHQTLADHLYTMQHRQLPTGWDQDLPVFEPSVKGVAGRVASGQVLNAVATRIPWLIGGSADLSPSTKTRLTFVGAGDVAPGDYAGRNLHFGVREHAMGAILNGLSHSKVRPFGSGFLIFSDYMKPAIRLSALMELPVIYVFTHDSIGVGEDGPTHQPVEQLAALRSIPGLITLRPADANEIVEAWRAVIERHRSIRRGTRRHKASTRAPTCWRRRTAARPRCCLLATGTEVALCVEAYEALKVDGIEARVVSMPSWELFEQQSQAYRDDVLPPSITARVAVEQASTMGWDRHVGADGCIIGMETFGSSAPLKDLQQKFGFTPGRIVDAAREQARRRA